MQGDILLVQEHHRQAARALVSLVIDKIQVQTRRYVIAIAGESGSGKSETGQALAEELANHGIPAYVFGQDDYFVLPPKSNDARRRLGPEWLGPEAEVRLDLLNRHLKEAVDGQGTVLKPLVDYEHDCIGEETVTLDGIKVVIVEGTYVSLLKSIDARVFIDRTYLDTLEFRRQRKRGHEVGDPFTEQVLMTEHKIISGHRRLADYIITREYDVVSNQVVKGPIT